MARSKSYQRETVIQQITAAFIAKGYEATSLSDLMTATGLNKKSLYNEFGSKEALFFTILDAFISQESAKSLPILTKEPYGISNIRTFFTQLFAGFGESGCLLTISLNEAQLLSEDALALLNATLLHLEEGFYFNLSAIDSINDTQARMFARNILSLMQGYSSLNRSSEFNQNNAIAVEQFLCWIDDNL